MSDRVVRTRRWICLNGCRTFRKAALKFSERGKRTARCPSCGEYNTASTTPLDLPYTISVILEAMVIVAIIVILLDPLWPYI